MDLRPSVRPGVWRPGGPLDFPEWGYARSWRRLCLRSGLNWPGQFGRGKVLEPVVHVRVNSRVRYGLRDHLAQLATIDSFHQYRVVARRRGSLSDEPHGRTSRKGHQAAAVDVADLPGSTVQGSLRPRR